MRADSRQAAQIATAAHARKIAVTLVALPGLPPKGDVSDWLDRGGTVDQLEALVEAAPFWTPPAPPP